MNAIDAVQKYRSKTRIYADILHAVQEDGEAKVTHILYKANLSHDRLTKYLGQLEDSGLLLKSSDGDRTTYRITNEGTRFLTEFHRMKEFLGAFGLDV
jgi:predicted transcriptional regulator